MLQARRRALEGAHRLLESLQAGLAALEQPERAQCQPVRAIEVAPLGERQLGARELEALLVAIGARQRQRQRRAPGQDRRREHAVGVEGLADPGQRDGGLAEPALGQLGQALGVAQQADDRHPLERGGDRGRARQRLRGVRAA